MGYKGKIYVAFDALNDMKEYKELQSFTQLDGSKFNFYDGAKFANQLDKVDDDELKLAIQKNMEASDVVLVLLSKTLKSMRRFSKWQIEWAINNKKAIIVMNVNRVRGIDYDHTPTVLKNHLCLIIPNDSKALELACMNWPNSALMHYKNNDKTPYRYDYEVYSELYKEVEGEE